MTTLLPGLFDVCFVSLNLQRDHAVEKFTEAISPLRSYANCKVAQQTLWNKFY